MIEDYQYWPNFDSNNWVGCEHVFQLTAYWSPRLFSLLGEPTASVQTQREGSGPEIEFEVRWSRTERKSCFPMSLSSSSSSPDRNKYVLCCKRREVVVDKSHRYSRERIPWRSWLTVSLSSRIYFCNEITTSTAERSAGSRKHDFRLPIQKSC